MTSPRSRSITVPGSVIDRISVHRFTSMQEKLRDPVAIGARFFWPKLCPGDWVGEGGRDLQVQWEDEDPHPMEDADLSKLHGRLLELGITFVELDWLWEALHPTLPHDGFGNPHANRTA